MVNLRRCFSRFIAIAVGDGRAVELLVVGGVPPVVVAALPEMRGRLDTLLLLQYPHTT